MSDTNTATPATATKKPPRQNREFRLMYRPALMTGNAKNTPKPKEPKKVEAVCGRVRCSPLTAVQKWSLVKRKVGVQFVDDLATFLEGVGSLAVSRGGPELTDVRNRNSGTGHSLFWRYLAPSPLPLAHTPAVNTPPPQPTDPPVRGATTRPKRPPILYNDPRIHLVYELRREKSSVTFLGKQSSVPPPTAPTDSDDEDRHDSDDGFPAVNTAGQALEMKISVQLDKGFRELKYGDFGGLCWQILTGIEARTKFSDSELRHEAQRIWKRQMNYHVRDNNCQQFCILLATAIRARNHSLLRVLQGKTVARQIKEIKDVKGAFAGHA